MVASVGLYSAMARVQSQYAAKGILTFEIAGIGDNGGELFELIKYGHVEEGTIGRLSLLRFV